MHNMLSALPVIVAYLSVFGTMAIGQTGIQPKSLSDDKAERQKN